MRDHCSCQQLNKGPRKVIKSLLQIKTSQTLLDVDEASPVLPLTAVSSEPTKCSSKPAVMDVCVLRKLVPSLTSRIGWAHSSPSTEFPGPERRGPCGGGVWVGPFRLRTSGCLTCFSSLGETCQAKDGDSFKAQSKWVGTWEREIGERRSHKAELDPAGRPASLEAVLQTQAGGRELPHWSYLRPGLAFCGVSLRRAQTRGSETMAYFP